VSNLKITTKWVIIAFALIALLVILSKIKKASKMNIIDIQSRLKKHTTKRYAQRSITKITDITVHHSETPLNHTPEGFAAYHVDEKGWPGIGYHYCINSDGVIWKVNELTTISYHNGFNNTFAIGICMIGKYDTMIPSKAILESFNWLVDTLKKTCPNVKYLTAHREYANTTDCCGKNLLAKMNNFRQFHNLRKYPTASWSNTTNSVNTLFNNSILQYNEKEADN
jgi:N-acetylmuramoyl-L-alanine amidase